MNNKTAIKIIVALVLILFTTFLVKLIDYSINNNEISLNKIELSPSYRQNGNPNAGILIIEFSDLACPACDFANQYIKDLVKYFPDDFFINYKHFPLTSIHPNSYYAAIWADCAGKQGKFWEMADVFFKNKEKWYKAENYEKLFTEYARMINLNIDELKKCVKDPKVEEGVIKDKELADKLGLDSTPTFFVNGKKAVGVRELIDLIKKEKKK